MISFVQFEFSHAIGPAAGRYVVQADDRPATSPAPRAITGVTRATGDGDVLAIDVLGAAPIGAGGLLRRPRPRSQPHGEAPAEVSLLRATLAGAAQPLSEAEAQAWLQDCSRGEDTARAWVAAGLAVVNLAIRAHRQAAADPYATEVTAADARAVRLGYATGEQIATGRWESAILLPAAEPSGDRAARLRPAQAVADALLGRAALTEAEDVALRGLLDLRHGRPRAAALGLRSAVELAAVELPDRDVVPARVREAACDLALRALSGLLTGADEEQLDAALADLAFALRDAREG